MKNFQFIFRFRSIDIDQESTHGADCSTTKRVISIEGRRDFYLGLVIEYKRDEVRDLTSFEVVGRFFRLALSGYVGKSPAGIASTI